MTPPDTHGLEQDSIILPDGRPLTFREYGTPDSPHVLIALHGTPGSGLKFAAADADARALGLRIVAPDRWGYGGSKAPPDPRLEDYADDLSALADGLEIGRFSLLGVSGGGPFAALSSHSLGSRVERTALVGPVGPMRGAQKSSTGLFHRLSFCALPRVPGLMRLVFSAFRGVALTSPDIAVALALARAQASDRDVMARPQNRTGLGSTFADGLAHSSQGPVLDMELFSRPWAAYPLPDSKGRVWIGLADRNVPLGPARLLASQLNAELSQIETAGHYWIADNWRPVLSWCAGA